NVEDNRAAGVRHELQGNVTGLCLGFNTDGSMTVYSGTPVSGTPLGSTDAGILIAGAFQHIEFAAHYDPIVGWFEIRVEGVTVLRVEDVNTGTGVGVTVI